MDNHDADFSQLMSAEGVVPLSQEKKPVKSSGTADEQALEARRMAAVAGQDEGLTTGPLNWLNPLDPIEWCHDGVQAGVYRNLRLGKYNVDARLDLRGSSAPAALSELLSFVKECMNYGIRTIMINIGKGDTVRSKGNQLKSYLNLWLPQLPEVMAFHTAKPQHGGRAGVYVLLRKSDEARRDNLERHQKRR
ncbi:DNA endonuclease SmrA [Neptunomonas marina]|uniref:DNA endonuclease SmrA n=1 Tax=Neptunomonas marina TaxID=1815562 RepID=A0A437QD24_9GAMM|nr:DNA endonuclease SmrA [Neptunomonas marina]RVU32447.1 DNA endonuclease SmrA [Neptunomonas marina]